MTAWTIQTSSSTVASSNGASVTDALMTAGTVPSAPSEVSVSQTAGSVIGGNPLTVQATTDVPPTALLIGTAADFAAGTPNVQLPCQTGTTAGCFTLDADGSHIESMPARPAPGAVEVMVVTLGVGVSSSYTYDPETIPTGPAADPGGAEPPAIMPAQVFGPLTLNPGEEGVPYSHILASPPGVPVPQSWAVSGGTVPPGLRLNSVGQLSGIPSTAGDYVFDALLTGFGGERDTLPVTLTIAARPVVTFTAADGQQGVDYSEQASVEGGIAPFTWSIVAGALPAGLTVAPTTGLISGAPTVAGTFSATVAAVDTLGQRGTATFSLLIVPAPVLTFTPPKSGQVAVPYSTTFTATGTGPLVWSIADGDLPAGLTLDAATGALAGTPTVTGSATFTVAVTDVNGRTAEKGVTLVIRPGALVITHNADKVAEVQIIQGQTVTYTVLARNTGTTDIAGATFTDDLAGVLDEAVYNGDGVASYTGSATGVVDYASPTVVWTGDLPAGASVRVTFSMTVKNPDNGKQRLISNVRSSTPGSNCPLGGEDPRCESNLFVGKPVLRLSATADVASATPGDVVSFRVEVSAQYGAFPGAGFSLDLAGMTDDAVYNNDGTATIGNVTATTSALSWTGDLAAEETAVITFSMTVADPPAGDSMLTGTVESTSPGFICGGESADLCSVTVPIQRPALTITNALAAPELLGHWTFDEGTGSTGNDTSTIESDLSHPATLTDGAGWAAGTQGASALSLDGVGGSAETGAAVLDTTESFSISAAVKLNSLTGNQAVVSQDGSATSGFTLGLRDGKFGFRRVATDSSDDTGAATAIAAVPPEVDRWYRLLGVYDRTASTLSLYIDGQLQQTVAAPEPLPSIGQLVIGRGQFDGAADFVDGTIDDVQVYRGLLTGGSPAVAGAVQEFSMTIANSGQTDYSFTDAAIDLSGALDDAVYNQGSAIVRTYGTPLPVLIRYDVGDQRLLWTGDLPVGAVITVVATVTVNAPTTGDRYLTTTATSSAVGSSCPIGGSTGPSICRAAAVVLIPELTITSTANVTTASPGSVVQYTVTARNSGQSDYQGAAFDESLAGILDDATYNGDVSATSGTASTDDSTVADSTLNWTGDLAAGASATITYSVTVDGPGSGDRTLSGTVTSPTLASNCASDSTDPRCSSSVTVLDPALSLSVSAGTATATPGSTVRYTVTAINTGETDYTGAVVTIDLTGVLDDARYRSGKTSTGTLSTVDNQTTWKLTLPTGATATAELEFAVNDPDAGDRNLTATVASEVAGSSCSTVIADVACSAQVATLLPALTIEKTSDVSTVAAGGTVNYTITITNTGATRFPRASLSDLFGGAMDDAMYYGGADATSGYLDMMAGALTWNGILEVGSSATITYSMTVNNPDTGDHLLTGTVRSGTAGSNCAYGSTDPRCTSAVSIVDSGLTIELSPDVATTTPDAPVTFTTTVTNTTPADIANASFVELLGGVFDDANVSVEPTADIGTVNFDGINVTWSGDLPAGSTATITVTFIVNTEDVGNNRLYGFVTADNSNCPQSGVDNRCQTEVPVARLTIDDTGDRSSVAPGESFRVPTTFTNNGQVPYNGISVVADTEDLRDDLAPTPGLTTRSGILTATDTTETWTGDIPVGGVITLYGNYTAFATGTGDGQVSRIWTTSAPGSNCPAGNDDHHCTLAMPVREPVTGLTVSQVADKTEVAPGDTVTYSLTVHNSGGADLTGISVRVELAGIYDDTMNVDPGTLAWAGDDLLWFGDLAANQTADRDYSVTLADSNPGDNVLISAVRAPGSNCPPSTTDPSCSLSVPVLSPQLVIVAAVDKNAAVPGDGVTFSTTVTNTGQTTYAEANFSIPLAGLTDDANIVVNDAITGTTEYDDTAARWNGELAPGATATVTISAYVRQPASGDRVMAFLVTSSSDGSNCADGSTDTRCIATATVVDASYPVTYTISADTAVAAAGGVVGFTVTAFNASESDVPADFTVSLTDILDDATVNGDLAASSGDPSIESDELIWSGLAPQNQSVVVSFSVTVNPEFANGILAGSVVSPDGWGYNCYPGDTDPRCAVTVPIAALHISQLASNVAAAPGSTVTLTTTVTNTGQAPYQRISVALSDAVSDQTLGAGDPTASAGTFHRTAGGVSWFGDVPVGEPVTISRSLLVRDPPAGELQFTAAASSPAPGTNCPEFDSDPDCSATVDIVEEGLTVNLFTDPAFVTPGGTVAYRMTVTNNGTDTFGRATAQVNLSGLVDDAALNPDLLAEGASMVSVEFHNDTITWQGDIEAGASVVITFSVSVNDLVEGDLALISKVGASGSFSNCPLGENRPACRGSVQVLIPELTITTVPDTPTSADGADVTYTVTAVNSGQTDYTGADFYIDASGPQTLNATASATVGDVSVIGGSVSWTGDLAVGAEVMVTFSATIGNVGIYGPEARLVVQSTMVGNNCGPETTDARCIVTVPIAGLTITNSADVSAAAPTDVISYTATFHNYGQAGYRGISIVVDLAGAVDDTTYNSDAAVTSGRIRADPGGLTLTWTGDLAPGETVVLTASVTVNNPDTGDKSIVHRHLHRGPGQ